MDRWKTFVCGAFCTALALGACLCISTPLPGADKVVDPDEQLLRAYGVRTDNASLLEFLRLRSKSDGDLLHIDRLIRQLGDTEFEKRKQASAKLVQLGLVALPELREAFKSTDAEIVRQAKDCEEQIVQSSRINLPLVVVRLLARRPVPEAGEALLRYLPYAADESVEEEIWYSLDAQVARNPRVHPALVAALKDALPARRAVAACILGRIGSREQRAAVRKLLEDPNATVRLRAAQGLLAGKDKTGIPTLIELLEEPAVTVCWQAEELLHWVAAEQAPRMTLGPASADTRKKCRDVWHDWCRQHGGNLALEDLDSDHRRPGLLLVCEWDETDKKDPTGGRLGTVWLCGCDGKARWKLGGLRQPSDAQLLPGNRVLVAEGKRQGITERDLLGKELWRITSEDGARECRRTPGGETLVFSRDTMRVFSSVGKEVSVHEFRFDDRPFECEHQLPEGLVLCKKYGARGILFIAESDPKSSRELRKVEVQEKVDYGCKIEKTRNNHYLLAETFKDRVRKVDGAGKTVWQHDILRPKHAVTLRNGNTLITAGTLGQGRIVEVTGAGKVVFEAFTEGSLGPIRLCLSLVRFGLDAPCPPDVDLANSVPYLLERLKSKDAKTRNRAAHALENLGPRAAAAVPALIRALNDPDEGVRRGAFDALTSVGKAAIPELLKAARDSRTQVRLAAVHVLGLLRTESATVVPALLEALRDDNTEVRRRAAWALGHIGPEARTAVPALIEALKAKDIPADAHEFTLPRTAAFSLGEIGPDAAAAVPALIEALKTNDVRLQLFSLRSLGRIGTKHQAVMPTLIGFLQQKENPELQQAAAEALGNVGPEAKAAVPALLEALEAKGIPEAKAFPLQVRTIATLAQIGPAAKDAVPVLVKLFIDKDRVPYLRARAGEALQSLDPLPKSAIPGLVEVLNDEQSDDLRTHAATLLASIGPDALPGLRAALGSHNASVRTAAIQGLGAMGPKAKPAIPSLISALEDTDVAAQLAAIEALVKIGPDAVSLLIKALDHKSPNTRRSSISALGMLGPSAKGAIPRLLKTLTDDDDRLIRPAAAHALATIGPDAVPALVQALRNPNADVRRLAIEAIGDIGPSAKSAIPALKSAQKDPDPSVRDAAARSIRRLNP